MKLSENYSTRWIEEEDGLSFRIRYVPESLDEKWRKDATITDSEGNESFDDDAFFKMASDHFLVDWKGFEDNKGKPAPCNAKNKRTLCIQDTKRVTELYILARVQSTFTTDFEQVKKKLLMFSSINENGQAKVKTPAG